MQRFVLIVLAIGLLIAVVVVAFSITQPHLAQMPRPAPHDGGDAGTDGSTDPGPDEGGAAGEPDVGAPDQAKPDQAAPDEAKPDEDMRDDAAGGEPNVSADDAPLLP